MMIVLFWPACTSKSDISSDRHDKMGTRSTLFHCQIPASGTRAHSYRAVDRCGIRYLPKVELIAI